MINPILTSLSGLQAASKKAEVAASNVANADSIGYTPKDVETVSNQAGGVNVTVLERTPAFSPLYSPDSPFADAEGIVYAPAVNIDEELLATKTAEMSYKANIAVMRTQIDMQDTLHRALDEKA